MRILIGLFCLFFLIIFHEFGHFVAAKIFKVKVETFSLGFGPVLFHKDIKGTDFRLSLIPLGGYCGMKGEKDFSDALNNGYSTIVAEPDSLYGIHPLKRLLIAFAGPFFNFLLCVVGFTLVALTGFRYYTLSNQIVIPEDDIRSTAKEAGLLSGDRIISVDGKPTSDFSELIEEISIRPETTCEFSIERDGNVLFIPVYIYADEETGSGKIGVRAFSDELIEKEMETYSFGPAVVQGFSQTFKFIRLTFVGLKQLVKGGDFEKSVAGPARVVDMVGTGVSTGFSENFSSGFVTLCSLVSLISISLCIMNLLPVPILDGGLILFAFIEFIARKKLNPKFLYYVQFIGLAFILFMFVLGLMGDIKYFLKKY